MEGVYVMPDKDLLPPSPTPRSAGKLGLRRHDPNTPTRSDQSASGKKAASQLMGFRSASLCDEVEELPDPSASSALASLLHAEQQLTLSEPPVAAPVAASPALETAPEPAPETALTSGFHVSLEDADLELDLGALEPSAESPADGRCSRAEERGHSPPPLVEGVPQFCAAAVAPTPHREAAGGLQRKQSAPSGLCDLGEELVSAEDAAPDADGCHANDEGKDMDMEEADKAAPSNASGDAEGAEADGAYSRDAVVSELWQTIQALEEDRQAMSDKVGSLMSALINAQEDSNAYKEQFEKIRSDGAALYATYQTKCERLKAVSAELENVRTDSTNAQEKLHSELSAVNDRLRQAEAEVEQTKAKLAEMVEMAEHTKAKLAEMAAMEAKLAEMAEMAERAPAPAPAVAVAPAPVAPVAIAMPDVTALGHDELAAKLESAIISNELLRSEIDRQAAAAQLASRAAAMREAALQEQVREAEARGESSRQADEDAAARAVAELDAERAQTAQLRAHIQTLLKEANDAHAEAERLEQVRAQRA